MRARNNSLPRSCAGAAYILIKFDAGGSFASARARGSAGEIRVATSMPDALCSHWPSAVYSWCDWKIDTDVFFFFGSVVNWNSSYFCILRWYIYDSSKSTPFIWYLYLYLYFIISGRVYYRYNSCIQSLYSTKVLFFSCLLQFSKNICVKIALIVDSCPSHTAGLSFKNILCRTPMRKKEKENLSPENKCSMPYLH